MPLTKDDKRAGAGIRTHRCFPGPRGCKRRAAFLGYAGFDQFYLAWICLILSLGDQGRHLVARSSSVAAGPWRTRGFYWITTMLRQFADAPVARRSGLVLLPRERPGLRGLGLGTGSSAATGMERGMGSPVVWTAVEKFCPGLPELSRRKPYKLPLVTQLADITGILGVTFCSSM